jgi:hypothetical protein
VGFGMLATDKGPVCGDDAGFDEPQRLEKP